MKPLIVANWKMSLGTLEEAKRLFNSVKRGIKNIKNVEVVICPPFLYLSNLKSEILNLKLGAQDCFWKEKGPFTGQISPLMLKDLACQYVIIGHSERRNLGETDEMINKKVKAAIFEKLKPILCIGETGEERKRGKTFTVLKRQLKEDLKSISNFKFQISNFKFQISNLIIAYEPVWAIGTGRACGIPEAKEAYLFIKKLVKNIPILYGGSVDSENAASYIKEASFEGLLVGGSSLIAEEFIKIVKSVGRG